jgi:hypothetical protein
MTSFTQMFSFGDDKGSEQPEEPKRPGRLGPPEDELGTVVPLGLVIANSERGAVALSHATAYTTGVSFDFVARARGLTRNQANHVFHEQHTFEGEDLPDALLRIGFEFADGVRVSNLGGMHARRQAMNLEAEPEEPLLLPYAGGGGSTTNGRVTMKPGYWLWPLPKPGRLRVFCEWPLVDISLTTAEIDGSLLASAARSSKDLWTT